MEWSELYCWAFWEDGVKGVDYANLMHSEYEEALIELGRDEIIMTPTNPDWLDHEVKGLGKREMAKTMKAIKELARRCK